MSPPCMNASIVAWSVTRVQPPAPHTSSAVTSLATAAAGKARARARMMARRMASRLHRALRRGSLQPVRAADHVEHDLVGAGADAVEAHVAPDALDAVLAHVARAAVDLDALVGDLDGGARGVELGHRDLAHRVLAVGEAPRRRVDELAGGLDLRRHLGELVAGDLEAADLAAEGRALLGVLQRLVEHALRAGDAARRADQPLALELPHDVVEARADLPEDCGRRHADVLE